MEALREFEVAADSVELTSEERPLSDFSRLLPPPKPAKKEPLSRFVPRLKPRDDDGPFYRSRR